MDQPESTVSSTDNETLFQHEKNPGLLAGLWHFLLVSRKWWLLPPILLASAGCPARAEPDGSRAVHLYPVLS